MPKLGGIADDYTGATDLATTLGSSGYRTHLFFGVPTTQDRALVAESDAVVIGLKSRSAPVDTAVEESLQALRFLQSIGCNRFYDKYCATFDSTPRGNIGPILDALMDELDVTRTIVALSFPEAGRTVYNGHLFVEGVRLDETSMRNHPITPITDSRIARLLAPQTRRAVSEVPRDVIKGGIEATRVALEDPADSVPRIFVVDAIDREELDTVAQATADWTLISGGSGLSASFGSSATRARHVSVPGTRGYKAVLSGSASTETQLQVKDAKEHLPHYKLNARTLREDFDSEIERMTDWAATRWDEDPDTTVLIYSLEDPADIDTSSSVQGEDVASLTERTLGACAVALASRGMTRLVVAGGETSGSVTRSLGIRSLAVGSPLSPGVAWALGTRDDGPSVNLLLKSGSLGQLDLFTTAWDRLPLGAETVSDQR